MSKLRQQPRIRVYFHELVDGDISMVIRADKIRLQPNGDCSQYSLLDVFKELNCKIDCNGVSKRPKLLLKLYCKLGGTLRGQAFRNHALANVRNGVVPLH